MPRYKVELMDTESDFVVEVFEFTAADDREAQVKAEAEAEYQGLHAGTITRVSEA